MHSATSLACKVKSWFPETADTGGKLGTLPAPGGSGFLRRLEFSVPPEPEPRSHGYFMSCNSKQENPPCIDACLPSSDRDYSKNTGLTGPFGMMIL